MGNCVRHGYCVWYMLHNQSNDFLRIKTYFRLHLVVSFAEITHRFQTARVEVQSLLLQCLQPWLENMELVAASVPPATPLSYIVVSVRSMYVFNVLNEIRQLKYVLTGKRLYGWVSISTSGSRMYVLKTYCITHLNSTSIGQV